MSRGRRARGLGTFGVLLCLWVPGCAAGAGDARSPGGSSAAELEIPGLAVSDLTSREQRDFESFVSELPAPCREVGSSLKQCVKERKSCGSCVPAVRFLFSQVRRGMAPAQVAAAYQIRFSPEAVRTIDLGSAPTKGAKHPSVVIVEWADFECSACAATAPLLDRKIKAYPEHVMLAFKHYPIGRHTDSEPAARAAVAAARQGKFWALHDLMFLNQQLLGPEGLERLAEKAGLNLARFRQDFASDTARESVESDRRQGDALGLTGTPMLYVNGRHFDYRYFSVLDDLDEWIQLEIEIKTGQRVTPREITSTTWPDPPETSPSGGAGGGA